MWPLFRFWGHFLSGVAVCPGFVALFRTFSFCCDGLSWNRAVFRDISFPARRFVLVLWRFSGHSPFAWRFVPVLPPKQGCFVASRRFSPGIVGFFGTFPFRRGGLSRFCRQNKDILLLRRFSPGIVLFFGTFFFRSVLSGLINIILLSVCGFIIFAPQNLTK